MEIKVESVNGHKLYYYAKDDWQKPVITEYQIFKSFKESKNIPMNYFAFPWANLIDDKLKDNNIIKEFLQRYRVENKDCFTVIQHIHFRNLVPLIKKIGIKYIFSSHKQLSDTDIEKKHNVKIIPISLYPAQYNPSQNIVLNSNKKKYLTSFIGQHKSFYLTQTRVEIFNTFNKYKDCFIKRRDDWHYEGIVYRNQHTTNVGYEIEYKKVLKDSKFSLCPSGSGPNSIRIWESMSYGSIPVILADTLVLPLIKNINWQDYFIIWKEKDLDHLHRHLINFPAEKREKMSNNCIALYNLYFAPNKMHLQIIEYFAHCH